jgi:hypothetical protein
MIQFAAKSFGRVRQWLGSLASYVHQTPRLAVMRTEALPEMMSAHHLYVVGERGEDWYAAMVCPCGCHALIELNLVPPGRPCWTLTTDQDGSPSLSPSIWRQVDCRAHFFVRRGRIVWLRNEQPLTHQQGLSNQHDVTYDRDFAPPSDRKPQGDGRRRIE